MTRDGAECGQTIALPGNDEIRVIVEGFTLEDFQGAEGRPFVWLYGFRDKPFMFERVRSMMAEQAKRVKFGAFARLCKGYEEENKIVSTSGVAVTAFSDQPIQLRCGAYSCTDNGVIDTYAKPGEDVVCPHPIMPIERLVNIETDEVKMRIAYRRGRVWRRPIVDKTVLSSARNIVALANCGVSVTSESAKALVKYLACMEDMNYEVIPEKKMVDRLGWIEEEGFSPFIEGVTYDSSGQFDEEYKAIRSRGSRATWMELAGSVRRGRSVAARIALAASFAAPLVARLDALPFLVHLWGSVSGIGKSVALVLAGSVWGNPEIGAYIKTTKATDVALEQLAFFTGNMPLCLDELQLIQNRKNFDEMIYSLCEGVGKSRGAKSGGLQRVRRWRNCIITTGEQPITAGNSRAGAVNRVMEVEVREPTFPDLKGACDVLFHNYGFAGREFVEKLDDEAVDEARRLQRRYADALGDGVTDKQALMGSILLAADALAERLIFQDGIVLGAEDIKPYLTTREAADTNRRAYDWLCEWIACNPLKFRPQNDQYAGECWGKLECDADGNPIRACIIRTVFDRALTEAGYSPASFLSWASKSCLVVRSEREDNKHMTVARRLVKGGPLVRCVVLILPEEETGTVDAAEFEVIQEKLPFD